MFAIRDARVFDGAEVIARATVVVRAGVIVAVGPDAAIPDDAAVIDGKGKTLLPGLIEAHSHQRNQESALEEALAFGVTTVLGMMGDPAFARARRAEELANGAPSRATLHAVGWALTVPGGLGTQDGPVPTLGEGDDVAAFVAQRAAEGSEYLEIMFDDGRTWGTGAPTLSKAQVEAAIRASHASGLRAVVDIASHDLAAQAIDAGVDGLAHLYVDGPNPELAQKIKASGAFVVATLPVLFSICDGTRGAALAADPAVAPYLSASSERSLRQSYHLLNPGVRCAALLAATRELIDGGVVVLAGTDAASPGTAHGSSMHDALALLVEAGMTPARALAAATSATATAFQLKSVGRIAIDHRADLILVDGDPTQDIRTTRNITAVWKAGVKLDREQYRAKRAADRAADTAAAIALGSLGAFEDQAGDGWRPISDAIDGGGSTADVSMIEHGARGTKGAIEVSGELATGANAWAGALRFVGATPTEPGNLGAAAELRFSARGDGGGTYCAAVFTLRGRSTPVEIGTFTSTAEWSEHTVSLAKLSAADRAEMVGILFGACGAGPTTREFWFELDEVALH